jgi:hypothetical protein
MANSWVGIQGALAAQFAGRIVRRADLRQRNPLFQYPLAVPSWLKSRAEVEALVAASSQIFRLDMGTEREHSSLIVLMIRGEGPMIRDIVEEAAVLASLALFIGMIAVWAHLIAVL